MNSLPLQSVRTPLHQRAALCAFDIFCRNADSSQLQEVNKDARLKMNAVEALPVLKIQAPHFSLYLQFLVFLTVAYLQEFFVCYMKIMLSLTFIMKQKTSMLMMIQSAKPMGYINTFTDFELIKYFFFQ